MALCKNCGKSLYLDRIAVNPRGMCMTIAPPTDADDTGLCRECRQELDHEAAMMDGPYEDD